MSRSNYRAAAVAAALLGLVLYPLQAATQWRYEEGRDPLTDVPTRSATVLSLNRHHFAFPYKGGTRAAVTIRQEGTDYAEVLLSIDRGQFACGPGDCKVRLRFDDDEVLPYTGSEPSDGSTDTLFLGYEAEFMRLIENAMKLRIEATFHREGSRVFDFNVEGLQWQVPSSTKK